jgi:hypothetical protein
VSLDLALSVGAFDKIPVPFREPLYELTGLFLLVSLLVGLPALVFGFILGSRANWIFGALLSPFYILAVSRIF